MNSQERKQSKNQHMQQTSAFSDVPAQGMFESLPFVVQSKNNNSEQPNLKTSLIQTEKYGHHLSKTDLANQSATTALQTKPDTQPVQLAKIKTVKKKTSGGHPYQRPNFPKTDNKGYLDEFNSRPNGSTTLNKNDKLDDFGYSRNHRVSYDDQQNLIDLYRTNKITQQQFIQSTNALHPQDNAGNLTGLRAKRMDKYRQQMFNAQTPQQQEDAAKKLSTHLNSSHLNVTIGNSKANSTIGKHFDPNFSKSPGGTHYSHTPRTKQVLHGFGLDNVSKPTLSPGGTRILSSHVNDRQGGFVPYNQQAMSPNTYASTQQHLLKGKGNPGGVSPTKVNNFTDF